MLLWSPTSEHLLKGQQQDSWRIPRNSLWGYGQVFQVLFPRRLNWIISLLGKQAIVNHCVVKKDSWVLCLSPSSETQVRGTCIQLLSGEACSTHQHGILSVPRDAETYLPPNEDWSALLPFLLEPLAIGNTEGNSWLLLKARTFITYWVYILIFP